ncbi:MAG TPA: DUF547 domain-containing protein [Saprospiraceae bacterium]|nr:DUF547 domain-containing protein [Saprospiraceae bacterium]
MNRSLLFSGFIVFLSFFSLAQKANAQSISHQLWDELLQAHVTDDGIVDYEGFIKEKDKFNRYLDLLRQGTPNRSWKRTEQLAYWINAYNAFTVKLIIDHYPVKSIKDIKRGVPFVNTVWDIKFIEIGGKKYDLNNIEHGILRKRFHEPRIHFAVNCASASCPPLLNHAYTGAQLNRQLSQQAKRFLADKSKNIITPDRLQLSKIFKWFRKDFTQKGSLIDFLNLYAPTTIHKNAKISYLPYDWRLNNRKY